MVGCDGRDRAHARHLAFHRRNGACSFLSKASISSIPACATKKRENVMYCAYSTPPAARSVVAKIIDTCKIIGIETPVFSWRSRSRRWRPAATRPEAEGQYLWPQASMRATSEICKRLFEAAGGSGTVAASCHVHVVSCRVGLEIIGIMRQCETRSAIGKMAPVGTPPRR